jgi:multidrug resistance protein, MATE family
MTIAQARRETPMLANPSGELRPMLALALPVVLVQVGLMAMGVVDTLMVGRVSAHALASVALGNLYWFNAIVLAQGTLMALDPLVAQAVGAEDHSAVARALQRGLVIVVLLSVFTMLLLVPAREVLVVTRQQPEIITDTTAYVHISIPGIVPYLAFVLFRQTMQALHRVQPIVWTIVGANLLNAGLNWVFVYGHLGSPAMGAPGSAVATLASRWLMAIVLLALSWPTLRPHLIPIRRDSWQVPPIVRMLRLGVPIGLQQLLESSAFGAIGLLMGVIGTVQVAAHQIAITLAALTFMVPLGVSAAAAVRVGYAVGAGDAPRARRAARAALACGMGFMAFTALAFLTVPGGLARLFTNDGSVIGIATLLIPVAGVFQVFDGAQAVGAGVLRGLGDTTAPLVAMLAGYWLIGLPVSVWLGFHTTLGAAGLWWGFVASLGIVAIFLLLRIRRLFTRELRRV